MISTAAIKRICSGFAADFQPIFSTAAKPTAGKLCNECGNTTLIRKDGCDFCTACGAVGACG